MNRPGKKKTFFVSGTSSINKVDSFDFSIYFQVVEDGYRFFEKRKVFRPCNYFIVKGNPREGVGSWRGERRILQGNLGAGHCVLTHSQAKICLFFRYSMPNLQKLCPLP